MAVDATVGPTANSYISNADAVVIWQADFYKSDYPTVEADQDQVLKMATALLDDVYGQGYLGKIEDSDNALYWPRTGVLDPRTGVEITEFTVFPSEIARATALQAYHIFKNNRETEFADQISENKREKLEGVGEVERGTSSEQRQAFSRPSIHAEVARIMDRWSIAAYSRYVSVVPRG